MKKNIQKNTILVKPEIILDDQGSYFIFLSPIEENDKRDFHIEIGDPEATNIFLSMNNDLFKLDRPDSHDLFISTLDIFSIKITAAIISDRTGSRWFSMLEVNNTQTKESTYIDCRPSDAIILCEKLGVDLYIYEDILNEFIKDMTSANKAKQKQTVKKQNDVGISKMNTLLETLIQNEEYEKAADLQKIINSKTKKGKGGS